MRKVQLLLLCLLVSVAAFAAEKVIKLPKPNMNRSGSVMNALSERHSTREYAAKALTSADLSDLLWAANGVNRPADGKRTAPSAMNKQDVDVYVVLPQAFVKTAPVSLLLVSDLSRLGDAKNTHTQLMGAVDAGIVSQNISIFCAAANLATVPRASMDTAKLKSVLKLKESQLALMNHPVGYYK